MAAFRTHVTTGLIVGYIAGVTAVINHWIGLQITPLIMFIASFVGSFLPDLDSDSGTPFDIVFNLLAFTGGSIAFYYCLQQSNLSSFSLLIVPPIIVLVIRYGIGELFQRFTRHRGIFHSIPATLIVTLTMPILLQSFSLPVSDIVAIALSIGLGFLSHLVLDVIYSTINFEGKKFRPKASLSSALSLTSSSQAVTIVTYALLLILVAYNWPLLRQVFP